MRISWVSFQCSVPRQINLFSSCFSGPVDDQSSINGATPTNLSTDSSPNTSTLSQHSTPSHITTATTLTNGPSSVPPHVDEKGDNRPRTPQGSTGVRRPKTTEKQGVGTTSRTTKPGDKVPGRTTATTGPAKSGLPTSRRTNLNQVILIVCTNFLTT